MSTKDVTQVQKDAVGNGDDDESARHLLDESFVPCMPDIENGMQNRMR